MAAKRPHPLDSLFAEVQRLTAESSVAISTDRLAAVITEIHRAPGDDKEKLRKKDQALVNSIDAVLRDLLNADWMPLGTVKILVKFLKLLLQIEGILWELKGEKGDPPKPQPGNPEPIPPIPTKA